MLFIHIYLHLPPFVEKGQRAPWFQFRRFISFHPLFQKYDEERSEIKEAHILISSIGPTAHLHTINWVRINTNTMPLTKRRRTIHDDDSDDEDGDAEMEFGAEEDEPKQPPAKKGSSTAIKKWLNPGAGKKSNPVSVVKKKALVKKETEGKPKSENFTDPLDDMKIKKVKKDKPESTATSLLANIAPPKATAAPTPAPVKKPITSISKGPKSGNQSNRSNKPAPTPSQPSAGAPTASRNNNTGPKNASPPPPLPNNNNTSTKNPAGRDPSSIGPAASSSANNKSKGLSALPIAAQEKVLLTRLQTLCDTLGKTEPVFQIEDKMGAIDVGGSFLYKSNELDFFDTNENGEIVLPTRQIPMFPEDFPPGEKAEHPLSWWGILDPGVGEGKYRNLDDRESISRMY